MLKFEKVAATAGYPGQLAVLAEDGTIAFGPAECKGYIVDVFGRIHGPPLQKTINSAFKGKISDGCLALAYWCGVKTRDSNAEKFCAIINELEEHFNIEDRSEVICPDIPEGKKMPAAPFVAMAPLWWRKWPVMVNFYCLMMRLSPFMRHNESFDSFRDRIVKRGNGDDDNLMYLTDISKSGNLDLILSKSANFFKRRGYTDYLLHEHDRGVVDYDDDEDKDWPLIKAAIAKKRGLSAEQLANHTE